MHKPINGVGAFRYAVVNLSQSVYGASGSRGFSASPVSAVSKNLFPFPNHPNPTPHQIFHLPLGADQKAIKSRYYELVKVHHPDSCHGLDPAISHERFQRIQQAYNFLRKSKRSNARAVGQTYAAYRYAPQRAPDGSTRRWTGQMNEWGGFDYAYDHEFNPTAKKAGAASEERKTEEIFHKEDTPYWIFAAVALVVGAAQLIIFNPSTEAAKHHAIALAAIDKAQRDREEFGAARREELRKYVEDKRKEKRLAEAALAVEDENDQ